MTPPRSLSSRRPGFPSGSGPLLWRHVAALTFALALVFAGAACGQTPPSTTPGSAAPATRSVATTTAPASLPLSPSVAPPRSPDAGRFRVALSDIRLPAARSRAVALAFGSTILVCGGLTGAGTTTGSILRIDPRSGDVTAAGALATSVHDAGGAVLDGTGFVLGGGRLVAGSVVQRVAETGAANAVGHLPAVRADLTAVSVGGEIVVVGGGTPAHPDGRILATTDGHVFRIVGTLRVAVRYPAVAAVGGLVYVIGGSTPAGESRAIQVVDPRTGVVRILGRLAHGLSDASALVVGGALLIAGGRTAGRAQAALLQLDIARGTVTTVGRLPYPVSDAAVVVVDGTGYLIGGEGTGPLASIVTLAPR
ncbi:MAG TPA: kelch repeat-containing protein [Candidatus Limnocylindrales bacterium]